MHKAIMIAIALFWCAMAAAQTTSYNVANLSWIAVSKYDDLTVIFEPVTYNVYAGLKGATKTRVATGLTETKITRTSIPIGVWCWHVTAVVKGVESVPSPEACKEVKAPAPATSTKPSKVSLLKFDPPDPAQVP